SSGTSRSDGRMVSSVRCVPACTISRQRRPRLYTPRRSHRRLRGDGSGRIPGGLISVSSFILTMSWVSRRDFLATSSLAAAGLNLGLRRTVTALPMRSRQPVATFVPELVTPDALRTLALAAVHAAQQAGASYADVRISNI